MKYVKAAAIITENSLLRDKVLAFNDKFVAFEDEKEIKPSDKVIDAGELFVAPGLIDIHIHGSGGRDIMEGSEEALRVISKAIVKNGVTAFLATTMTMEIERIHNAMRNIRAVMQEELPGAQLLGAHMEGPFISEKFKGAQDSRFILKPQYRYIEGFEDVIKIVTLAPEADGAVEFIGELAKHKIIASIGHTAADFERTMEAINAGATHITHTFNAMTGLHHRKPGAAAAALLGDTYCELIADTIHIHPALFEILRRLKGIDRITLVTDCMEAGDMPNGKYSLGGQEVFVEDGEARLEDGTLAGSVLRMNEGIWNFYKNTKAEIQEVFRMGALNPAAELGLDKTKGSVALGKDADFILIDDKFSVYATFIKGKCVYKR